ncbi:hypothetical protein HK12_09200 [Acetobacter orientalis]|uniref:Uncharacterized protein n=1 Tax=Acetobacter orientalis TaxID=146474 RepID=A0A251ZZW4_9PROT|nr:hypothetical protein HK12_09200 [Acetobacter orientalis]
MAALCLCIFEKSKQGLARALLCGRMVSSTPAFALYGFSALFILWRAIWGVVSVSRHMAVFI